MNYRLSSAAQRDLDDCWFYIAQDNEDAADRFLDAIGKKLVMLAAHPNVGRSCDELAPDLQRLTVGSHVVFFRRRPNYIEIARILHGARDIEAILNPPDSP
jgi:toxin ParE1/3/4